MEENRHVVCGSCGATNRIPRERDPKQARCGRCKEPLFSLEPKDVKENVLRKMMAGSDVPILVDFWAPWCGPCRAMAPQLARAAEMLETDVRVVKLNTDAAPQLAGEFQIRGIPTLALFSKGREVARTSGAMDAGALVRWVRSQIG